MSHDTRDWQRTGSVSLGCLVVPHAGGSEHFEAYGSSTLEGVALDWASLLFAPGGRGNWREMAANGTRERCARLPRCSSRQDEITNHQTAPCSTHAAGRRGERGCCVLGAVGVGGHRRMGARRRQPRLMSKGRGGEGRAGERGGGHRALVRH